MEHHHSFAPSVLDQSPRPAEQEIRLKPPAMNHEGRTNHHGGARHG